MFLDKLLTTSEVASVLQVTTETVRNMIHAGRLKASRIGRGYRVRTDDVEIFIARQVSR